MVLAVIETIIKFLRNEESYVPFRATVVGCGGSGKSYIINTILTIVRKMTKRNITILVGAPSGAATYNVHGSTLHHLLGIGVSRPEDNITQKVRDKLLDWLKNPLCLFIDKRSMLSSKVLGAAGRNIRQTVYNGQNSWEIWGGVPAVILLGDGYQLWPVIEDGAIQGYFKSISMAPLAPTNKQIATQLLYQWGSFLFTHVMTESVSFLNKIYRVKSKHFCAHRGIHTWWCKKNTSLHLAYYKHNTAFITNLKQDQKTMWIYAKNTDKDKTNIDMLIQTSKNNRVPVARLDCCFGTNWLSGQQEWTSCINHFNARSNDSHTDTCVGARLAISNVNILPEVGLYNGTIGIVVEIIYQGKPVGPNDKEHNHLPDYLVVDFPNLKLPTGIPPWDELHKTVSSTCWLLLYHLG
jgi:hypothetical protein